MPTFSSTFHFIKSKKKHFWTVLRMVGHNINVVRTVGHDFGRCRTDHMQFFPLISLSNGFSWKFLFDFSHFQIKFVFFHWISSNFSLLRNDSVLVANKHYRVIAFESSVWQSKISFQLTENIFISFFPFWTYNFLWFFTNHWSILAINHWFFEIFFDHF